MDGLYQGYSSSLPQQEKSRAFSFRINETELSWIASVGVICMPIGSLCSGISMEKYGRKKVLQASCIFTILGWFLILVAPSVIVICLGRCLNGLASGVKIVATMYVAEITESPKYRAILLSLQSPMVAFGILMSFVMGYLLSRFVYALVVCCVTFIFLAVISLLPESPHWLLTKNDVEGAAKSLKWFRLIDANAKTTNAIETRIADLLPDQRSSSSSSLMAKIRATRAWKPYLIVTAFFMLQQFSGVAVFVFYAVDIYEKLSIPIDSSVCAVVLATLQFFSNGSLAYIIDKLDRRKLVAISVAGVFANHAIIAIYAYLFAGVSSQSNLVLSLPMVCAWLGVIFASPICSLPWIMIGEVFPAPVKDFMGSLQLMTGFVVQFVAIKMYPFVVSYVNIYGVFTLFSVCEFLTIFYSLFVLPETRGKTLAEIEKLWLS